ncbi:MAG: low molecular weight phosphatase family protein [Candidatus Acidiferrum sp.]
MNNPVKRPGANENPARKKVLFVCMGNACRSPLAESITRRDAADVIEPFSAGLSPLGFLPALTTQTLIANGNSAENLESTPITRDVWDAADLVVNMSGVPKERAFPDHQKVEDWDVQDPYGGEPAMYQNTYDDIRRRVARLADQLRKAVPHQTVKT